MAEGNQGATGAKVASGKVVKYIGTSDVREIDAKSWASIGVEDQKKVTWDKSNNFTVQASDLSAGALKYADEVDDELVVADADTK